MLGLKPRQLPKSWKSTIHLPRSSFPPRAPAPADQKQYLKRCTEDLYAWQQQTRRQSPVFTLHDGPPYANGDLHVGHAFNKILKDITCRVQLAQGKQVNFVPGWDCHGLPIELKALERRSGQVPRHTSQQAGITALGVRTIARELATATVERQKETFRGWGIMADWDGAWRTMDKDFELRQLNIFRDMVKKGQIYRQCKPVFWSPSSRTALAEAELEYSDRHISTAAFVKFALDPASSRMLLPSEEKVINVLIWTTTPWTIPANQAIAYRKDLTYVVAEDSNGERLLIAESRLSGIQDACGENLTVLKVLKGEQLARFKYQDLLFNDLTGPRPFLSGEFVSSESGTGLVHLAPGHGMEDYELCLQHGIPAFAPVDDKGLFTSSAAPTQPGLLDGKEVLSEGNRAVLQSLSERGRLFATHKYSHRYPYDWRSKKPIIIRATDQWFANVGNIQTAALKALESVRFVPETGKSRLQSFVKNRKEWCISRQRAWGVPIPALFHHQNGEALLTEHSVDHIVSVFADRGIDAWWRDPEDDPAWTPPSLREKCGSTVYRRGFDTMDVWFDSGTSWTQMGRNGGPSTGQDQTGVADVYLEGTDQHRGWFQSSLLTHIASKSGTGPPTAPFRSLITHGFTLDKDGHKMSKSLGNVISPQDIMDGSMIPPLTRKVNGKVSKIRDAMGVDALRLWVSSCDFAKDISITSDTLRLINNSLAKYRVTFKQLLGILDDYYPSEIQLPAEFGQTHKIAAWQLENARSCIERHYRNFEYHKVILEVNRYVNQDLSAFYLECIKDAAYCGIQSDRVTVQATCTTIYYHLQQFLAPCVPMLIEESWEHAPSQIRDHLLLPPARRTWQRIPEDSRILHQPVLSDHERSQFAEEVPVLLQIITAVQRAQEQARAEKKMGSSLQSLVILEAHSEQAVSLLAKYQNDLETLLVVSRLELHFDKSSPPQIGKTWSYSSGADCDGVRVTAHVCAPQISKCVRCFRFAVPLEVTEEPSLCIRCERIIEGLHEQRPDLFEDLQSPA